MASPFLFADLRERASGIPQALSAKGLEVRMKRLHAGDYVLAPHLAIERKTVADFIQSIFDKRLFAQVQSLRASFAHPLFLLEETQEPKREIHPHAYRGALFYVSVLHHIPILHTGSAEESVETIYAILQLLQAQPEKIFSLHEKKRSPVPEHTQRHVVETLPGIGPQLADALLQKFGSLQAVFAATVEELMQVAGIGRGRAEKVHEILRRQYGSK
jgi:ERCC4-type nuclease